MKQVWVMIIVCIGTVSCMNRKGPDEASMQIPKRIEIEHQLSEDQLKDIERIQKVFGEVTSSSIEKTVDDFKRDKDPAHEIKIWLQMADAYEGFTKSHTLDENKKQQAYELILLRSMMPEKEVREKIKSTSFSDKELKELFSYYTYEPEPLPQEND